MPGSHPLAETVGHRCLNESRQDMFPRCRGRWSAAVLASLETATLSAGREGGPARAASSGEPFRQGKEMPLKKWGIGADLSIVERDARPGRPPRDTPPAPSRRARRHDHEGARFVVAHRRPSPPGPLSLSSLSPLPAGGSTPPLGPLIGPAAGAGGSGVPGRCPRPGRGACPQNGTPRESDGRRPNGGNARDHWTFDLRRRPGTCRAPARLSGASPRRPPRITGCSRRRRSSCASPSLA